MALFRQTFDMPIGPSIQPRYSSMKHTAAWVRPSGSKLSQLYRLLISSNAGQPDLADGNALIEWDTVNCVDLLVESLPICAICLDHVSIPHVLECGHCYCLSCILLHFTSACSCCVCSEYARPSDLRSARIQLITTVHSGSSRTFQLTRTDGGVCLPVGSGEELLPSQSTLGWWFSRAVRMGEVEATRIHLSELARVEQLPPSIDEEGLHAFGTAQAVEFLTNRIASMPPPSVASPTNRTPDHGEGYVNIDINSLNSVGHEHFSPGSVYTYQLVDGQHVYLDPVWVRALLLHYTGDADSWAGLSQLPHSLNLSIVHTTVFTVDYEARRRFKPIAHLPLGTTVTLCDVDLRGVVSAESLEALAVPIARRLAIIKKVKAQKRIDKRDVRRANAVPLSEEWANDTGLSFAAPPTVPTADDFMPLPGSSNGTQPESDEELGIRGRSFANMAAGLAQSSGDFQNLPASHRRERTEEELLLDRYSRRETGRSSELSRAIEQAVVSGAGKTKKKGVKLRIAG